MENFCPIGKLEKKNGYDVCRGVRRRCSPAGELRYDLTLIYPGSQTAGHYHSDDRPELYEVLSSRANFLMQDKRGQQTYLVIAEEGDKIIFPPGFSMRTINPSPNKELLVSNWVDERVKNDYNAFQNVPVPMKLKPKPLPRELENLEFLSNHEKYKSILTIENLYEQI
jgi:oxalate decarboxylase/phosphoglucose isomerase-like protein (cupin superfamily)